MFNSIWWFSSSRMTIRVELDSTKKVVNAAPIARKFIGQPSRNLAMWMAKQGSFRKVRLMPKPPYQLLLSDPPWKQSKGGKKNVRKNSSGTELDYQVCNLEQIQEHHKKILSHCSRDLVFFMWTIEKYLPEAEIMLRSLGFKLHARLIWNKVTGIPAAFTIRYGHEYLLYAYRGKLRPVALDERGKIHSVFTEKCTSHSTKPKVSFEIIQRLYPSLKKLEMYARCERPGWDRWGNEVVNSLEIE